VPGLNPSRHTDFCVFVAFHSPSKFQTTTLKQVTIASFYTLSYSFFTIILLFNATQRDVLTPSLNKQHTFTYSARKLLCKKWHGGKGKQNIKKTWTGSYGGVLGHDTVQGCRWVLFRRNRLPPSSGKNGNSVGHIICARRCVRLRVISDRWCHSRYDAVIAILNMLFDVGVYIMNTRPTRTSGHDIAENI
jgi:hypothetical protein